MKLGGRTYVYTYLTTKYIHCACAHHAEKKEDREEDCLVLRQGRQGSGKIKEEACACMAYACAATIYTEKELMVTNHTQSCRGILKHVFDTKKNYFFMPIFFFIFLRLISLRVIWPTRPRGKAAPLPGRIDGRQYRMRRKLLPGADNVHPRQAKPSRMRRKLQP